MPRNITVAFNDGTSHVYQNAPDDITPEQVQERAEKQFAKTVTGIDGGKGAAVESTPTEPIQIGASAFPDQLKKELQNADWATRNIAGAGSAVMSGIEGIKGLFGKSNPQTVAEQKIIAHEAPVGNIAGNVAMLAPTALIPGANTLVGSALIGAGTQAALTPGSAKERGEAALYGAGGAAAGTLIGQGANKLAEKASNKLAALKSTNAPRDATLVAARDAGLVVSPSQANPSAINKALEGFSGKIQTGQAASVKNQDVINNLARKSLGIEDDVPITGDVLKNIRNEAGQAYEALRGVGTIKADKQYASDLGKITQKYAGASKDFPELASDEIGQIVSSVNKPEFSANSAIDAISILRDKASASFAKGDKAVGNAYRQTSQAMEDAIERRLIEAGDRETLKAFQAARTLIAKTYSVEKALNTSGNVNAQNLASQLKKGKPLSGELKTIAEFADQFPKAAQNIDKIGSTPGVSPLDAAVGVMAGGAPGAAWFVGRPATRAAMLSDTYQRVMAGPQKYQPNMLLRQTAQSPNTLRLGGSAFAKLVGQDEL